VKSQCARKRLHRLPSPPRGVVSVTALLDASHHRGESLCQCDECEWQPLRGLGRVRSSERLPCPFLSSFRWLIFCPKGRALARASGPLIRSWVTCSIWVDSPCRDAEELIRAHARMA